MGQRFCFYALKSGIQTCNKKQNKVNTIIMTLAKKKAELFDSGVAKFMPKHKNSLPTVSISNKKIIMLKSLEDNLKQFEDIFQGDEFIHGKAFCLRPKNKSLKFCLLYLDGMVDAAILDNSIIKPIINAHLPDDCEANADIIINQVIFNHYAKKVPGIG